MLKAANRPRAALLNDLIQRRRSHVLPKILIAALKAMKKIKAIAKNYQQLILIMVLVNEQ